MQALKILRRKCALPTESPLQIVFYNKIRNDPLYFAKQHRNWLQTRVADINEVQRLGNFVSEKKSTLGTLRNYGKCFYELSKARLSLLVVLTSSTGFVLGSGEVVDTSGLAVTSIGTAMAAASANSFNQIMEVKNDSVMKRTMRRPLPSGRLSRAHALAWAIGMGVSGVSLLAYQTNLLTAGLGAANIGLYSLVYTPLKQIHPINTWVGAVVGAIPPLMGWASASGHLDPGAYVLAAGLYFWQLPHFMALAWLCKKDYAAGGYKMLSFLDLTGKRTAAVALRNSLYLLPLGFVAVHFGVSSEIFAYENLALTSAMAAASALFYMKPNQENARKAFRFSLVYLPFLMAAMLAHRVPNQKSAVAQTRQEVKIAPKKAKLRPEFDLRGEMYQNDVPRPPVAYMIAAPFPFLPLPAPTSRY